MDVFFVEVQPIGIVVWIHRGGKEIYQADTQHGHNLQYCLYLQTYLWLHFGYLTERVLIPRKHSTPGEHFRNITPCHILMVETDLTLSNSCFTLVKFHECINPSSEKSCDYIFQTAWTTSVPLIFHFNLIFVMQESPILSMGGWGANQP